MDNATLPSAAFLWDESFLWGVMAYEALAASGLAFEFVRAKDVSRGGLDRFSSLFVPGGWASNKLRALGDEGVRAIKDFVSAGGTYIGFCGGAGLATRDGIGLAPVRRMPTKDRVPSFSGRIRLTAAGHPLWKGLDDMVFHAWWPSQFMVDDTVRVLASYDEAQPDSFSSDINVGDANTGSSWSELERIYGIKLDPTRLRGEPAVVEASFGRGRVVLSLVHFDTPGDRNGRAVLVNMWKWLGLDLDPGSKTMKQGGGTRQVSGERAFALREIGSAVASLMDLGTRNFLWFSRDPMLIQWRRGVRGLEYCTLNVMIRGIVEQLECSGERSSVHRDEVDEKLARVRSLLIPFVEEARRLLVMERFAMLNGHVTYGRCDDPKIREIRERLFSRSKSYGGLFKELIDQIDDLYFIMLTRAKEPGYDSA